MRQLLEVVHQAEELPLRIHLPLAFAAASILAAWRWKSARVPMRLLLALPGSLTPSMANI
jgi:hypothetical protein